MDYFNISIDEFAPLYEKGDCEMKLINNTGYNFHEKLYIEIGMSIGKFKPNAHCILLSNYNPVTKVIVYNVYEDYYENGKKMHSITTFIGYGDGY